MRERDGRSSICDLLADVRRFLTAPDASPAKPATPSASHGAPV
jgi:hypothetical protein